MNALTPFIFEDSPVRVIVRDGEPWFVLADVCRVLDLGNPTRAAERLDPEEKNTLTIDDTQRFAFGLRAGNPVMNIVSESGLYALVLTSRKAEAKVFKRWLVREVLPAIRRTGSYGQSVQEIDMNDSKFVLKLLEAQATKALAETKRANDAETRVAVLAPQVATLHLIAKQEGDFCLRDCAKMLSMKPKTFIAWLIEIGWVYRDDADGLRPYQPKVDAGYLKLRRSETTLPSGRVRAISQTLVTAKGQVKLGYLLSLKQQ